MFAKINRISWREEAVFTKISRSRNQITTIIKKEVNTIEEQGVPLLQIVLKNLGSRSTLAIAIGLRDEARMPAFPVVTKARIAAVVIIKKPKLPKIDLPPKEIGVRDPCKFKGSTMPIVTKIVKMYKSVTTIQDKNIPLGRFLAGSFISPAIAAILVEPAKEWFAECKKIFEKGASQ